MHHQSLAELLHHMAAVSFLATVEGDQPCMRAMTHFIDADGVIWYPTLRHSAKVRQIEKNPKVVVSFFDPGGRSAPVSVYGIADIITDPDTLVAVWQCYDPSIQSIVPARPGSANFAFIKITPQRSVANTYRQTPRQE
jgi:general stress protein 26